ncbi:MAG: hypothetical protein HY368_02075 [Candidatus Aenigmarchaeota archaeon]|nr:hypothetical protein [Candidatus Aenigmarchaeota archaeon]
MGLDVKGQWFIISAVVITSFFVILSGALRDYTAADFLPVASSSEAFYFENVRDMLKKSVTNSPPCSAERNLTEAIYYTTSKMASLGYIEDVSYVAVDCSQKKYSVTLYIASDRTKKNETFTT